MSKKTTPKRTYDATRRRARAEGTRDRVIEAAARVFLERGFEGATVPAIAAEARVALRTVYRAAPGKAGLLEVAVAMAVAGGVARSERPVDERPAIRAVIEERDPRVQLALYAATQPGIWDRSGPLLRVLDAAAASDPALQRLRQDIAGGRRAGIGRFVTLLEGRGALRQGLSADRAADIVWAVCAQANYDALVVERGWTPEEYQEWLAETLHHSLIA